MDQVLKEGLRELLKSAAKKIDRIAFEQEPNYTAALFGKLHEERIESPSGQFLKLSYSISNDRGPNSAEKKTGTDIGMIFRWEDPQNGEIFEKAVLAQAKNYLHKLSNDEKTRLSEQCIQMSHFTKSYIVMDCPYDRTIPSICRSSDSPPYWSESTMRFDDYLVDVVLECHDGDTSKNIIEMAKRADRRMIIETNSPSPILKMSKKIGRKM